VISYELPAQGEVSLKVFDLTGRLVRTLVNGVSDPGVHYVTWDGRNQEGAVAGAGVYFYRFEADGVSETRKMVLTH
jgi:flagellar hook assembly protein FlgD